jgi:hypothetical protein
MPNRHDLGRAQSKIGAAREARETSMFGRTISRDEARLRHASSLAA